MEKMHFTCPCCNQRLFVSVPGNFFPVDTRLRCHKCNAVFAYRTKIINKSDLLGDEVLEAWNQDDAIAELAEAMKKQPKE
jgi:transposase-like protein